MNRKRGNHETCLKHCKSAHQKFIEIKNKHRKFKYHVCYNDIDMFKYVEEEVTLIPTKHYYCNWIPKFLHQLPEVVTIESHNKCYDKMAHLKSKTKSWQGASFGMCNEHSAI